ncbi:helicase-related protein [Rhodanobacter thiooxydans]|uniref:helicase-related protein n=1 Tax=Rhodanobacter thiooxydans TaxID=416169 RepID=UPI0012901181|nr:helicase-related protein [Rhodanobacter thiooxydans]MCW0202542.1 helicase-related protein [Rhodanobacter thiooxydans]
MSSYLFVEPRLRLIQWVRRQLVGPPPKAQGGLDDALLRGILPTERFPCGAIYPVSSSGEGIDPAGDEVEAAEAATGASGESSAEPAIVRRYIPPSSLGFSFFITGRRIELQLLCSAVRYERTERDESGRYKNEWTRKALVPDGSSEEVVDVTCPDKEQHQSCGVLADRARLDILWRRFADGWIVTVALCNTQVVTDDSREFAMERAEHTLFEANLRCVVDSGEVGEYPRVDRRLLDDEEQEIELQYAGQRIFAIGHGCAADWGVANGWVTELRTETMPMVEVPQMTADTGTGGDAALSLAVLSRLDDCADPLASALPAFVDGYAAWAGRQGEMLSGLAEDDRAAGERICQRIGTTVKRMRGGLALLGMDAQVRLAFALANRAMLDQMRQHDVVRGKSRGDDAYRWRPFQLAFLLTVLESAADPESEDRDTVDLIWFPTGGGKTEAYLGLIAFQIALRRLRHPHTGGGTCVLMRYTLRLLTRDQYLRASRLICALERVRRERDDLGTEPISVGLWVGKATCPNTFADAATLVAEARARGELPAMVLDSCPWCGQGFNPRSSYQVSGRQFGFLCSNTQCDLYGTLPCNVVDEALYANPPTMLVATVDKFARLAWEERASAFFGGAQCLPPELIIQDELHLISSALGSVAGLYEAGLDTVLRLRGIYPKYIASTATIRMATQQVRRLYGRVVSVFPSPGLSRDDSYFARTVPLTQHPGRIYVGYLAPMLNRQKCLAPLAAAMLLAPDALFKDERERAALLDAWWTQIVYHGSLKGVGNSHTAFVSDVGEFIRLLDPQSDARRQTSIAQLTSLQTAEENSAIFTRLALQRGADGCLDAVLATNMVSVGLDVARLALMTINGQPLTTAEYIQASSRVGRSDVPGVAFMNYYRDQARSLSHYESFRPFHEAFYRFVEPTSVTPFTYQARLRALHAALVIVIRHARIGFAGNDDAARFDPDIAGVDKAIREFKRRCGQSATDTRQQAEIETHIDSLVVAWRDEVERCRTLSCALRYQESDNDKAAGRLLYNHDDRITGLWPTLQSLRNVENSALLKVL